MNKIHNLIIIFKRVNILVLIMLLFAIINEILHQRSCSAIST